MSDTKEEPKYSSEKELPELEPWRCGRRTKKCRSCGYRYEAGDKALICPKCGADRRCRNKKVETWDVCRMHGAKGGRPPGRNYRIAQNLQAAYNQVLASPDLINNAEEIAALWSRNDQIMHRLDKAETRMAMQQIRTGLDTAQGAMMFGDIKKTSRGLSMALEGLKIMEVEREIWWEFRLNADLLNKMRNFQQKWDMDNKQMLSAQQVVEVITLMLNMIYKYIPDKTDRRNFALELRQYLPKNALPPNAS